MPDSNISLTGHETLGPVWGNQGDLLRLHTTVGDLTCLFRQAPGARAAVLWAGSLAGEGPTLRANPIPQALSTDLVKEGIASLLLRYRETHDLGPCIQDTRAALAFLEGQGFRRIALVGHSFSGAVVISVAPLSQAVTAVVTLASQTYGARRADLVSPRPLLLVHGMSDQTLNPYCSEQIYSWAKHPKRLVLLEGAGHGLRERLNELLPILRAWLAEKLTATDEVAVEGSAPKAGSVTEP